MSRYNPTLADIHRMQDRRKALRDAFVAERKKKEEKKPFGFEHWTVQRQNAWTEAQKNESLERWF